MTFNASAKLSVKEILLVVVAPPNEIFNPILGAWWHIITAILIATKVLISREDG